MLPRSDLDGVAGARESWSDMKTLLVLILGVAALLGAGCDLLGTSSADAVKVQLNEWAITADPITAPAGVVTFDVQNSGKRPHDFAVLLAGEQEGDRYTVIGEIKGIEPEDTKSLTVTLERGTDYELASLRVTIEGGELVSDYDQGMQLVFAVE